MSEKYRLKNTYFHRRIVDSDVLISVGENVANFNGYIELNESAAFLCDELKEPRTEEELAKALADRFSIFEDEAKEDVSDFLGELKDNGMVDVL